MIDVLQQSLKGVGDLTDIAKALEAIGDTQRQLASLPCSVHPDRTIVAIAPMEEHARLCQECFDRLVEESNHGKIVHVQRLGNAVGERSSDAEGLDTPPSLSTREESRTSRGEDVHVAPSGDAGGQRLRDAPSTGDRAGAADVQSGGVTDHAPSLGDGSDAEANFIDAYERFWR